MFTAEDIFRVHHAALNYTPLDYDKLHEQRKAMYVRMAEAISLLIVAREQEYHAVITALVELLECDPRQDYGEAYPDRYTAVLARAKALMDEKIGEQ